MSSPPIQWYPGHIAKAEKALLEQLSKVDVVIEVRDARIPMSTHHPRIDAWLGDKARVLVINRVDMITPEVRQAWQGWFKAQGSTIYFTDAKQGKGVQAVLRAAQAAGQKMNQRRTARGMKPRPVRAVVIGFPNVGKSALINRLLKRKIVTSARRPGVTRQLRWVRISDEIELLDAPGIIPLQLEDQTAALKLAICEDIGEAAYDNQRVAAAFVDLLKALEELNLGQTNSDRWKSRYHTDPSGISGESFLVNMSEQHYQGDIERAARQFLNDFRRGDLGNLALEFPPDSQSALTVNEPM